ncbi:hypothetical protein SPICUR_08390 [Spiribacter curvatus]|uniref:Glycosyltransferase RgtA/B/C/D-like domain-containing protein n=1 Tax=Spiribacter curvatus TaxID=1335757 RepID=U5T8N7_9GAMM|nr:hypothetical protein SPICUR_08390 [Spiribacter curvatus]
MIAVAIAGTYITLLFPAGFVTGDAPWWHAQREDISQYLAGLNAFLAEPWNFPLLSVQSIVYPQGTNAIFLDVIPALALILKLFVPDTALPINPYGAWLAASITLQAVFGWLILRTLQVRQWGALIALSFFLVSFPALTHRLGHVSLTSHWLLLAGLLLYLRGWQETRLPLISWSALLLIAFYINLYLTAMLIPLYAVSVLAVTPCRGQLRFASKAALAFVPVAASTLVTILPLPGSSGAESWGFGYYSMNLLAPLTGGYLLEIPGNPIAHGGQGEGFNYLGFGVILLFLLAVWRTCGSRWRIINQHRYLFILCILLTLYALSSQIYFGETHILTNRIFKPFEPITDIFRSSGRFFWLPGYTIALFAVLAYAKRPDAHWVTPVFIGLALIQLVDLQNHHENVSSYLHRPAEARGEIEIWDEHVPYDAEHLVFSPLFGCQDGPPTDLLAAMRFAIDEGMTINTGYVARHAPACNEGAASNIDQLGDNVVVFFDKDDYPKRSTALTRFNHRDGTCDDGQSVWICTP